MWTLTISGGSSPARALRAAAFVSLAASLAGAAAAAEREEALRLAAEGRCDAAEPLLESLTDARPADALIRAELGRCRIRSGDYAGAAESLEAARALDPALTDLDLDLAVARYHQGDLAAARQALARASATGSRRAELPLYEGLLALQRAEDRSAAESLERARQLDANVVEPVASYYGGLAWLRAGDRDRARVALERVILEWPDTAWQEQAERALERLEEEPSDRWALLTVGFEWDDNVVLQGNGVALPREIRSQRDKRGVWALDLGAELWRSEPWSVGAGFVYAGSAYNDLNEFNTHAPAAFLWLDRRLTPRTTLRLEGAFSYAWVDSAPFVLSQRGRLSLFHHWDRAGETLVYADFRRDDYRFSNEDVSDGPGQTLAPCLDPGDILCAPPGTNEERARNRDGSGWILAVEQRVPVAAWRTQLLAGYRYHRYSARGREYSFQAHEFVAGARVGLPFQITLDATARWTYRPYRNPTTFPDPDGLFFNREYGLSGTSRREEELRTDLVLERRLSDLILLSARWSYTNNRSTADVFDYDRHAIGAYLTFGFGG